VYRTLRFDAAAADAEAWSDALLEAGALSVELSDPYAGAQGEVSVYAEPGSDTPLWPLSRVSALFAQHNDAHATLRAAAQALGLALPAAEAIAVPEQDWVRATQAQFAPIRIDEGLWIVPSWHAPPRPDAIVLRLDPGVAFGTGSHPTTALCLQWLRATLRGGECVLDYGCGSGILAIGAARLGAGTVVGTDIDPQAVAASRDNAARNGVDARFTLPDGLPAQRYDAVVANILANPLILLAPVLAQATARAGRIALSGVLAAQADDVMAAYAAWFNIARWREAEGWVLLAGARREDAA
jgi:ribosomal protein L11 methyltransferase